MYKVYSLKNHTKNHENNIKMTSTTFSRTISTDNKTYVEHSHLVEGECVPAGFTVEKKNHRNEGLCIHQNGTRLFNWWKKHGTDQFSAMIVSYPLSGFKNTKGFHYLVKRNKDDTIWDGSNGSMKKYTPVEWGEYCKNKHVIDKIEMTHEDMVGIGKKIHRVAEFELDLMTMFRIGDYSFSKLGFEDEGFGRIDKTKGAVWWTKEKRKLKKRALRMAKKGKLFGRVRTTGQRLMMGVVDGIAC